MPQDFTNIFFDNIIQSLASVVNGEFSIPIYYDEHKGNQSFLIIPESDTLVEQLSSGVHREYNISISYQLKFGSHYTKNTLKQVSGIMERLKRLIFENETYDSGSIWINAKIESIEYERDEDDESVFRGIAIFSCNNIEVI
jgi:hypothetical protein